MLHDYLTPETYDFLKHQIFQDVCELYPNFDQLKNEIEHSSSYLDPHKQILCWLQDGAIYSNSWQLRQWMPASFSCFTDSFVWQLYKEIATNVVYENLYNLQNYD